MLQAHAAQGATLAEVQKLELALRRLVAPERRSGRVDIVRKGNAFEAKSRGVREFTLLLSPDVIEGFVAAAEAAPDAPS